MRKYTFFLIIAICITTGGVGVGLGYALYRLRVTETLPPAAPQYQAESPNETGDEASARSVLPEQEPRVNRFYDPTMTASSDITDTSGAPVTPEIPFSDRTEPLLHRYTLSLFDGYVAVFFASDAEFASVKEITDTPVDALTTDERLRLAAGIKIYSDDQLVKILQDYGS